MSEGEKRCFARIDIGAIKNNFDVVKTASPLPVWAVVKADAYGHGAAYLSKIYDEMGAAGFCVACFDEAVRLREAGIAKPIIILGHTRPEKAPELAEKNIIQTVYSLEYARRLDRRAARPVECHIKLDTGMGRLGFDLISDKAGAFENIKRLPGLKKLRFTGMFSHFPVADEIGRQALAYTQRQLDLFSEAARFAKSLGFDLKTLHGQNSAGIARNLSAPFNAVRAGIVLYGRQPSRQVVLPGIRPAMELTAFVTHKKRIKAGRYVGYGMNYRAREDRDIVTISAGYRDGVTRSLGKAGLKVKIRGRYYPVAGNICMDQMMAQVTGSDVEVGDAVTVIGSEEYSWETCARMAGTIPHELMCNVSKRVPRIYFEDGKAIHTESFYK